MTGKKPKDPIDPDKTKKKLGLASMIAAAGGAVAGLAASNLISDRRSIELSPAKFDDEIPEGGYKSKDISIPEPCYIDYNSPRVVEMIHNEATSVDGVEDIEIVDNNVTIYGTRKAVEEAESRLNKINFVEKLCDEEFNRSNTFAIPVPVWSVLHNNKKRNIVPLSIIEESIKREKSRKDSPYYGKSMKEMRTIFKEELGLADSEEVPIRQRSVISDNEKWVRVNKSMLERNENQIRTYHWKNIKKK